MLPDGGPLKPTAAADAGSPMGKPALDAGIDGGRRDAGKRDDDDDVSDEAEDEGTDADGRDGGVKSLIKVSIPGVEKGVLAPTFRCNEELTDGISPEISWTPGPVGTRSYAVTLRTLDVGMVSSPNWTIFDIPADVTLLPEGIPLGAEITAPVAARQARNSQRGGTAYGYRGPCGRESRYELTVYALDVETLPDIEPEPLAEDVEAAIEKHVLLTGVGSISFTSGP